MQVPGMQGMPMPNNMMENEMIGAIKIKDGLFIGDEYASTVSTDTFLLILNMQVLQQIWLPKLSLGLCTSEI